MTMTTNMDSHSSFFWLCWRKYSGMFCFRIGHLASACPRLRKQQKEETQHQSPSIANTCICMSVAWSYLRDFQSAYNNENHKVKMAQRAANSTTPNNQNGPKRKPFASLCNATAQSVILFSPLRVSLLLRMPLFPTRFHVRCTTRLRNHILSGETMAWTWTCLARVPWPVCSSVLDEARGVDSDPSPLFFPCAASAVGSIQRLLHQSRLQSMSHLQRECSCRHQLPERSWQRAVPSLCQSWMTRPW